MPKCMSTKKHDTCLRPVWPKQIQESAGAERKHILPTSLKKKQTCHSGRVEQLAQRVVWFAAGSPAMPTRWTLAHQMQADAEAAPEITDHYYCSLNTLSRFDSATWNMETIVRNKRGSDREGLDSTANLTVKNVRCLGTPLSVDLKDKGSQGAQKTRLPASVCSFEINSFNLRTLPSITSCN